jgi:putative membrane protein
MTGGAGASLAAVNATLNALSAVLLTLGFISIRRHRIRRHARLMLAAFLVSTVFLACYLVRVYLTGTHRYPGGGLLRAVYLGILSTHMMLAVVTPPLVIRAIYLAARRRFPEHRRLVRVTLPIWMYVSVTGVVVYLMLYHPPG